MPVRFPTALRARGIAFSITLEDPEEEAIHRRFREGHYRETAIAQAAEEVHRHHNIGYEKKGVAVHPTHLEN